jgi:hypothetical protein
MKSRYSTKINFVKGAQTRRLDAGSISEEDLKLTNPTLKSIIKVERLFKENIEFDSKNHMLRELNGSMKAPVLNIILRYLKGLGKIIDNEDGSWTWIYAADNEKLKRSYKNAVRL